MVKKTLPALTIGLVFCLVFSPGLVRAQTGMEVVEEDVVITRANYSPARPSESAVKIYAGQSTLQLGIHNYDIADATASSSLMGEVGDYARVTIRIFLDNVLTAMPTCYDFMSTWWGGMQVEGVYVGQTGHAESEISFTKGEHEVRAEVWHGTETQPQDEYRFEVLVLKPEVSSLHAGSKVVRAIGDNSLTISFTNGGNENMRQAVLTVENSGQLTVSPTEVQLGDVEVGENASVNFTVSSASSVTLGTTTVRFSLSFVDYAGISHTENVLAQVEVYRLIPTLTLSVPDSVENNSRVEIVATLKDPNGNPIPNENVTLTAGGTTIGTFKTDSSGVARASYAARETGALDVGGSFSGSTSYEASSASTELTVVPQAPFPWWVFLLVPLVLLAVGATAYLKLRKRPTREPKRARQKVWDEASKR